jgi:hypothetical protein
VGNRRVAHGVGAGSLGSAASKIHRTTAVVRDTLPAVRVYPLALFGALLLACGGGDPSNATVALCEEQCSGAECEDTDCLSKCEAEYDDAEKYGCVAEYEAILACANELPDVCAIDPCSLEVAAFSVCFGFYCGQAEDDPDCA